MFKYVKFAKVKTPETVLEFRNINDTVKVNTFSVDVVSLEGAESDINTLIASQPTEIGCVEITKDEIIALIKDTPQMELAKLGRDRDLYEGFLVELEAERVASEHKQNGEVYTLNGVTHLVPFMKDDADGMLQVKAAFDMGLLSTNIHFSNGTIMPIASHEFLAFAMWFVEKRNSFFA